MYIACLEGFKPPTYCLAYHFVFRRHASSLSQRSLKQYRQYSTVVHVRGLDFVTAIERIRYAIFNWSRIQYLSLGASRQVSTPSYQLNLLTDWCPVFRVLWQAWLGVGIVNSICISKMLSFWRTQSSIGSMIDHTEFTLAFAEFEKFFHPTTCFRSLFQGRLHQYWRTGFDVFVTILYIHKFFYYFETNSLAPNASWLSCAQRISFHSVVLPSFDCTVTPN